MSRTAHGNYSREVLRFAEIYLQLAKEVWMKSWKTTVAGAVPGMVLFLYEFLQGIQAGNEFNLKFMLLGLALAGLGAVAKDFNVSGTGKEK